MIADTLVPHDRAPSTPATATRWTSTSSSSRRSGDALFTIYSPVLVHLPGTPAGTLLAAARRDRAAGRRPHRPRRLGVARARPHPARGLLRHARPTARPTTPSTSTRSRRSPGGRVLHLGPRHVRALRRRPRRRGHDRCGRWAARRATSGSARARASGSSTTPRMLPRRPDQPVRRRGRPAAEGARLARAGPGARPAPPPRDASSASYRRARGHLGAERGQRADAARAATCSSASASTPFFSEFTRGGRLLFDAQLPGRRRQLPRPARPLERDAPHPARRSRSRRDRARPRRGLRELERRHDGRALAGAGRPRRAVPSRRWRPARGTGSRPASTSPATATRFAVRALGARGRAPRDLGAGGRTVTAPGSATDRLARRVLPRAVVLAARVDGPRRLGAAACGARCTARAASSCSSPSTTRPARWPSSSSCGGCAAAT